MRNVKKILAGCLLVITVSVVLAGCGNKNTAGTETTAGTNVNGNTNDGVTEKNTIQNDGAENMDNTVNTENGNNSSQNNMNKNTDDGVLEDLGAGIGEAGDDIIDGAEDAADRLADDGIDSENTGNTDTGVQ